MEYNVAYLNNINYRSLSSLARDLKKEFKKKRPCMDFIKFKGMVYTMDEYDFNGEVITYGNVKNSCTLFVETVNRYKSVDDLTVRGENYINERIGFNYYE